MCDEEVSDDTNVSTLLEILERWWSIKRALDADRISFNPS